MKIIHIEFANIAFSCPYCGKEYNDANESYLRRCNANNRGYTAIKCDCGNRFYMTYNIQGRAVGFK